MSSELSDYWYPPEWYPHQATWLSWPHNINTWPNGIEKIFASYAQFVKIIAQGEKVHINVVDKPMHDFAYNLLGDHGVNMNQVEWHYHPTEDAWIRDHGPAFLLSKKDRGTLIIDWDYNAWGGKYPPYHLDAQIPQLIASKLQLPSVRPGLVMEGGALDFNGAGTVLTTESCLLNPNRNPTLTKEEITKSLCTYYQVQQVLWLKSGIEGDDTDGHVDDLTRFVNEDTVVTMVEENEHDSNHKPLQDNLRLLNQMKLRDGRPLNVIPIQMPRPLHWNGQRLPASYANFYICNTAVIVPTYNDPQDEKALNTIGQLFSDRPTLGIDSTHLIGGLGSFHCLSQQQPAMP